MQLHLDLFQALGHFHKVSFKHLISLLNIMNLKNGLFLHLMIILINNLVGDFGFFQFTLKFLKLLLQNLQILFRVQYLRHFRL